MKATELSKKDELLIENFKAQFNTMTAANKIKMLAILEERHKTANEQLKPVSDKIIQWVKSQL